MNKRNLIILVAMLACFGSGWAVYVQRQELTRLRGQTQLAASFASGDNELGSTAQTAQESTQRTAASSAEGTSSELLRLRGQVNRLTARQRELASVPAENEKLRAQVASGLTNAAAANRVPPGYIRKAQAQMVGYSTPENTVQSFLWALRNHDFAKLLQALTPAQAQKLQDQVQRSGRSVEDFFKDTEQLAGLAIRNRTTLPDGSMELEVEFAPGVPMGKIQAQPVDGEWKLAGPF